MAALPCAKEIIDELAEAARVAACAGPSVAMYAASGIEPTEAEARQIANAVGGLSAIVQAMLDRLGARAHARG